MEPTVARACIASDATSREKWGGPVPGRFEVPPVANLRGGTEIKGAHPSGGEGPALGLLRERVEAYLRQGIGACQADADGDYHVTCDSARVFICPRQWTEERTIVRIFSITNVELAPTADLLAWIMTRNFRLTFGHFAYNDAEQSVWFIHNLLGDFLDRDELITAVQMVATQANDHDDVIKEKFGGRLFTESS